MGFYTYTVYMQKFLVNTSGFAKEVASQVVTGLLLAMMVLMPLMGWISDRVGRKPVMLFSYGAGALLAVPILSAIAIEADPVRAFLLGLVPIVALSGLQRRQRHRQGGALPDAGAGTRRRPALCDLPGRCSAATPRPRR